MLGLAELVLFNVYQVVEWWPRLGENDFRLPYAADKVGLAYGWPRIYDLDLQRAAVAAAWPDPRASFYPFLGPPPEAWLVLPLAWLPAQVAYALFVLTMLGCLAAAGLLAAGPGRLSRLAYALSALGFLSSFVTLAYGQPVPLLLLAAVLAWRLLASRREVAAGLVLTALVLKPQDALLVAPLLLVAGYRRAVIAWVIGAGALTVASLVALGPAGVSHYLTLLAGYYKQPYFARWSIGGAIAESSPAWYAAELVAVLAAAVLAWLVRRSPAAVISVGVIASLVVARYLTPSDLPLLLAPAWLLLAEAGPVRQALAGVYWLLAWFLIAVPWLTWVMAPLVAGLALAAARSRVTAATPEPELSPAPGTPAPVP